MNYYRVLFKNPVYDRVGDQGLTVVSLDIIMNLKV